MTRSRGVWGLALRPDAVMGKAQCSARVPPGRSGPDGLAVDAHDRLTISNPGHGCVRVVDAHGVRLYRIVSAAGRMPTNRAVAPDGRGLVVTESKTGGIPIREVPTA